MRRFTDLLKRFRRDESGAFLVIFALLAIVLIATSGAVVDFTYTQTARSRAQNALDSAALALQSKINDANAQDDIKVEAQKIMTERLADSAITAQVNTVTIDTTQGKLNIQAQITVPTAFVQLVGIKSITAQLTSEATQGSKNIEVAVALDTTGSMSGQKLTDLKNAMTNSSNTGLIDVVVKDTQTPTYSKMAIIPWSNAVNVGSTYAASVRGPETAAKTITAASWATGSAYAISGVTKASPGVVTLTSKPSFANGDTVVITGVTGMTQLNGNMYKVSSLTTSSPWKFSLQTTGGSNVSTWFYSTYWSGGSVQKCLYSNCDITVTSAGHGFANGDYVHVENVNGMTGLNGNTYAVANKTSSTLELSGSGSDAAGQTYSSGGNLYCTLYGCSYYRFTNASGGITVYKANNCATERLNHSYDDTAPSTNYLDFNYTSGGSDCITQEIQPLTSDKTALRTLVNSLSASGSTAGHLGLAWGWYMISPNFAYLWPTASKPAAYGTSNLVKAVILMTDGQFNLQYCNGVLDQASGWGSGHINCNSIDDSRSQAETICTNIKSLTNPPILYTVGFDLGADTASLNFLKNCATDANHFFDAESGADLDTAFKQIAQDLNELRLSK
jgi:Flp pilus assembly protein TadG